MGIIKELFQTIKSIKHNQAIEKKYRNMSMDALKALNDEELDQAIDSMLYFYEDCDLIDQYNPVQLTAITIKCFDCEINNGGLCQFFVNSSSDYAPYVIDSLNRIGATETRKKFERFVDENNINLNDLSSFKIHSIEEYQDQTERYPFDDFDDWYYENEDINALLIQYIRKHIDLAFQN